jgi:hypothetical protein
MKINVCDVCASEKKFSVSNAKSGFKGSDKVDLCEAHRGWGQGKKREEFEKDRLTTQLKASEFLYS